MPQLTRLTATQNAQKFDDAAVRWVLESIFVTESRAVGSPNQSLALALL